ncbi:MAG: hypothetical protein HOQ03_02600 [Thermoleophilia bacterium]|nr:hypothetical protein [Thermoleophilia bacterium]
MTGRRGVLDLVPGKDAVLDEIDRVVERAYTDIRQGELVDTCARSAFEDTRRKAAKFGAMGVTLRASKPLR